jgi:hypothetical protein
VHLHLTRHLRLCIYEANVGNVAWTMTSSNLPGCIQQFEENGLAMRYLDRKGRVAWKCSPKLLSLVRDARREVEDDWEDLR